MEFVEQEIDMSEEAFIYEAIRTPRGKQKNGSLHEVKPLSLVVGLIDELRKRHPDLDENLISDVILGCVSPVGDQAGDHHRDEALHLIRKRAKRLRYTAAATGADNVSQEAKVIQTLLGDHQDSVVSREHLIQQAIAANTAGEDTFTYGLLYQQEADLAERCREQLEAALRKLDKAVRKARD